MNERIQEMARQAGAQHRLNLGVEEFCFEHSELKKFAELIVRESLVDFYRNYLDTTSDEDITLQVKHYVQERFGVDE